MSLAHCSYAHTLTRYAAARYQIQATRYMTFDPARRQLMNLTDL